MAAMLVSVLIFAAFRACTVPNNATLHAQQTTDAYVLSVPVSQLEMTIPHDGLVRGSPSHGGSTASPRYFYFEDRQEAIILSGWFESQDRFKGLQAFWAEEVESWLRHRMPLPKDVLFEEIGGWQAIQYEMAVPVPGICNLHLRAHWIQAGTWIDIHLSVTSRSSAAVLRERLVRLLNSIIVKEKKANRVAGGN
jgi:hypothetical protein